MAVDLTSPVKTNKRALDVVSGGSGMAANVSLGKRSGNRNHNSPRSHINRANRCLHKCLEEWTAVTGEDLVQRAWTDFCIHPHDFHCMDMWAHQGRCLPLPECFFGTPHLVFNKQRDVLELMMPHPKREHDRFQKFVFIFCQGSGTILEDCFKCHLSDSNDRGSRDWQICCGCVNLLIALTSGNKLTNQQQFDKCLSNEKFSKIGDSGLGCAGGQRMPPRCPKCVVRTQFATEISLTMPFIHVHEMRQKASFMPKKVGDSVIVSTHG